MILEQRFTEPDEFVWKDFERDGRKIRTGRLIPAKPKAAIILLQGLSEFGEKYFEFARELYDRDYALFLMDWFGQGGSGRYLDNPHKRHSESFDQYIADAAYFIDHIVKPNIKAPLILLGHSMGGHIGLRYLAQHPKTFQAAAFTAPFIGINEVAKWPEPLKSFVAGTMHTLLPDSYVFGHTNWRKETREIFGPLTLSSDPDREKLHNYWSLKKPELQVGGVTWGWVHAAVTSCATLQNELPHIQTPILIARAGKEKIVDNAAISAAANTLPDAKLIEIPGAFHEILMERDEYRDKFLEAFFTCIQSKIA